MKKIKILHYIPGFNTGGIESVFLNWFKNIDRSQISFELLVRNYDPKSPMLKEYLDLGGVIHTLNTPSLNIKTFPLFYKEVRLFFKNHRNYDFLHVHVADEPFIISSAKKWGISHIGIHAHTTGYNISYRSQKLKTIIRNSNVKRAAHYFACSTVAADWMFPNSGKVKIIYNGIDTSAYAFKENVRNDYREKFRLNENYVLIHVGRFSEVKNHLFLLEVFKHYKREKSNSKLMIAGDGPLKEEIQNKINDLNLTDDVIMLGARPDVPELLQAADTFLLPSKFEGLGVVAVEAQASGLPTIVSDRVPKEVALTDLVRFLPIGGQDEKSWVTELISLGENPRREEYSSLVKKAGYDIQQTTNELVEYYQSVLE